jgi:hypothetical protein
MKLENAKPGDILRYRSRPRNKDEILCHNQVAHYAWMSYGSNGFRYFVCRRGDDWVPCPCGWRPANGWDGIHFAIRQHVRNQYKFLKPRLAALAASNGKSDPFGLFPVWDGKSLRRRRPNKRLGIG